MDFFQAFDEKIFVLVNQTLTHPILDSFFVFITNLHKYDIIKWVVLPAILAYWFWKQRKQAVKLFFMMILLAGICDAFSYRILKASFQRPRPNHIEHLNSDLKVYGPKSYSFPSNHALTTTALMTFIAAVNPVTAFFVFLYAALVAYSRIYVGVHFFTDVAVGMLVGFVIAKLYVWVLRRFRWL